MSEHVGRWDELAARYEELAAEKGLPPEAVQAGRDLMSAAQARLASQEAIEAAAWAMGTLDGDSGPYWRKQATKAVEAAAPVLLSEYQQRIEAIERLPIGILGEDKVQVIERTEVLRQVERLRVDIIIGKRLYEIASKGLSDWRQQALKWRADQFEAERECDSIRAAIRALHVEDAEGNCAECNGAYGSGDERPFPCHTIRALTDQTWED